MTTSKRWMDSVLAAAETCDTRMPWERGARRQEMIARREAEQEPTRLRA